MLSVELIIIEGLNAAVHKSWITEDEKQEWLNTYIEKRNTVPPSLVKQIIDSVE